MHRNVLNFLLYCTQWDLNRNVLFQTHLFMGPYMVSYGALQWNFKLTKESIPVGCVLPACADRNSFNNHQISLPRGGSHVQWGLMNKFEQVSIDGPRCRTQGSQDQGCPASCRRTVGLRRGGRGHSSGSLRKKNHINFLSIYNNTLQNY